MKFNIKLDESLFDDEFEELTLTSSTDLDFDDDFTDGIDHTTDVLPGPSEGPDTGVAAELITLINDEWEAIQGYNNAIATLRANMSSNPFYADAIRVLEEISAEENVHVGQLQEVLQRISPNAKQIQKGTEEAKFQLVNGVLPVQSWDTPVAHSAPTNDVVEQCSITDVDDDM